MSIGDFDAQSGLISPTYSHHRTFGHGVYTLPLVFAS